MNLDNLRNALLKIEEAQALLDNHDSESLHGYLHNAAEFCRHLLHKEEGKRLWQIFGKEVKP